MKKKKKNLAVDHSLGSGTGVGRGSPALSVFQDGASEWYSDFRFRSLLLMVPTPPRESGSSSPVSFSSDPAPAEAWPGVDAQ